MATLTFSSYSTPAQSIADGIPAFTLTVGSDIGSTDPVVYLDGYSFTSVESMGQSLTLTSGSSTGSASFEVVVADAGIVAAIAARSSGSGVVVPTTGQIFPRGNG